MSQPTTKPFKEWQIVGLILIALLALGFGEAIKKHRNNFPSEPLPVISPAASSSLPTRELELNGVIFQVEIAQSEEEHSQGLSGRPNLGENQGMLFVFDSPIVPQFWMKDMNFPIDMIWIDQNKTVIGYEKNISPDTFPKTFSSGAKLVNYVLEVPAGTVEKNGLQIGDLIHFSL